MHSCPAKLCRVLRGDNLTTNTAPTSGHLDEAYGIVLILVNLERCQTALCLHAAEVDYSEPISMDVAVAAAAILFEPYQEPSFLMHDELRRRRENNE